MGTYLDALDRDILAGDGREFKLIGRGLGAGIDFFSKVSVSLVKRFRSRTNPPLSTFRHPTHLQILVQGILA